MKKITIVVPCYNEEETIKTFYETAIKFLVPGYDFKICYVNDGSKDKSLSIMKELANLDDRVKYVSFSRNFGKEAAMYAGLEAAKKMGSDAAIMMDVDLQDPPELIKDLVSSWEEGYKLVYTKQRNRKGASKFKAFCSLSFYKVYAFLTHDKQMAKGARDYCLLDSKVIEAFLAIKDTERFTKGIYHYVGFEKKCIEFDYVERVAGTTKWNFRKLLRYAFLGIREFSRVYEYIPLTFFWLSFIMLIVDVILGFVKSFNWNHIRLDIILLAVFLTVYYLFKLLYDIRAQVQNRPIYIEEESNIKDKQED